MCLNVNVVLSNRVKICKINKSDVDGGTYTGNSGIVRGLRNSGAVLISDYCFTSILNITRSKRADTENSSPYQHSFTRIQC